ncbi:MAG: T9SS type A sorting domain-containing protein [Ignavibacteria bacterium]|nr:T9SS type A sorting domain-containing protein [Ignavibacteria bacterium]
MINKIFLILLALTTGSSCLFSQYQEWVKVYNGSGNSGDEGFKLKVDSQGNTYVLAKVLSTGFNTNIGIIKYDAAGVQQWAVEYNGPANLEDYAADITIDNNGNSYICGIISQGNSNLDIVTLKYNSAGTQQWAVTWAGTAQFDDEASAIYCDDQGNVYVCGSTEVTSGQNYNYITLKYNSSGALQWAKQYSAPINSYDMALFIGGEGSNVYITGTSNGQGTGSDFLTIKYNSSGDSSWVVRYNGTTQINEIPYGFKVDASGNVYVTGMSQGLSSGVDYVTIKYNSSGVQQWLARYTSPGASQDIPEGLNIDNAGNVYVTGRTRINSSYNDFATVKYNSSGAEQWVAVYNNNGVDRDDYGYDVIADNQGNVYVTGNSQESGTNRDALTVKYNSAGIEQWVARYDGSNADETYSIGLDAAGNVYVAGYNSSPNQNILTIKYSQVNGITQLSNEIPQRFRLEQNYHNPFNPVTNIKLQIASKVFVSLKLYDITGREVKTLVNEELQAGIYNVDLDASSMTSGVYFYRLVTKDFSDTKKMILLK